MDHVFQGEDGGIICVFVVGLDVADLGGRRQVLFILPVSKQPAVQISLANPGRMENAAGARPEGD